MDFMTDGLIWWITMFDLPALGGLLGLVIKTRHDQDKTIKHLKDVVEARHSQMREALAAFKLEAAKNYASITDMRELEGRLVSHLLRIEEKLDRTTLKTEALSGARRYKKNEE